MEIRRQALQDREEWPSALSQIIEGLNAAQTALLTEQALQEPDVTEVRITRQGWRRRERAARKARRRQEVPDA